MIITNKHNLPEAIVNMVKPYPNPNHPPTRVSVTDLISPVQKAILQRRYYDEIEEDAMDRVWLLFGNFAHFVLEQNAPTKAIAEKKITVDFNGCTIVGKSDILDDGMLDDYKTTTVWSDILEKGKAWDEQVNLYACLWRLKGKQIDTARVVVIFRDWRKGESMRYGNDYPTPMKVIDIKLWSFEEQLARLKELTDIWKANTPVNDAELKECTPEQQYADPTKYAVMKRSALSKAKKVCDTNEEAEQVKRNLLLADASKQYKKQKTITDMEAYQSEYLYSHDKEYFIEKREGIKKGCEWYCSLKPFCKQYERENQQGEGNGL